MECLKDINSGIPLKTALENHFSILNATPITLLSGQPIMVISNS